MNLNGGGGDHRGRGDTHPQQVVLGHARRDVVEVEHSRGGLDDVLGGLAGTAEAVVARHGEVLVAAGAVLQLKHLAGDHRVLLGHTETQPGI